jgi:hypothetical protein
MLFNLGINSKIYRVMTKYRKEIKMNLKQDMKDLLKRMETTMNEKDYRQYMKLTDTLIDMFNTYMRLCNPMLEDEFCDWYKEQLQICIKKVHYLMNTNNHDEYRCLAYIYNKLLKEISIFKDIKIIEDININEDNKEKYDIAKRMAQYEIVHGVFYKYIFKAIENEKINIIFFYDNFRKVLQFQNIVKEQQFRKLFKDYIKDLIITKDRLEIRLNNDSNIKFVGGYDNARGHRCHYAIVDTDIDREIFSNVVRPITVLFDIDKEKKDLKDNYNIEFVEM